MNLPVCLISTLIIHFVIYKDIYGVVLFVGSAPNDSSPIKIVSVQPLPLISVYYTLASAGIIFCFICFLFNIIFRKRKYVYTHMHG